METRESGLQRTLGFKALAIYGIGDILGAGIYALIGAVAADAGVWSPLAFLVAMTVACLTGLTYAAMVSRYPRSGGEASFCLEAFGSPWLAFLVGWLVFCSGIVSMATVTHAFGNYVVAMWPSVPAWSVWLGFLTAVSVLNFRGMRQSSTTNIVLTCVEAAGLLLVIVAGVVFLTRAGVPADVTRQTAEFRGTGILSAAAIAFFAFVGFEDMVNVAEEVREPERVFPRAILTAVFVCGAVYAAVSTVAVCVLPISELSRADAPLVAVVRRAAPVVPPVLFTVVALTAVANTGLLNGIMASRLVYGMARQHLLPAWLATVHHRTRTPHRAVLCVFAVALALVFSGTLVRLAETTSLLLLVVFATVNLSALRMPPSDAAASAFRVPRAVPVAGLLTCCGLGAFVSPGALQTVIAILAAGLLVLLATRPGRAAVEHVQQESDSEDQ